MGRVKLAIKKIGSSSGRQSTYGKRKNGLFKKASELSILCDIDIVLLMFSPSGRPTLYTGERSTLEEIIGKFSQLTPQERAKRELESLEALKRAYRKSDHDLNIQEFLDPGYQTVEDMTAEANLLRTQLSEVQKNLSYWTNIDKIDSVETLEQLEISLFTSLNQIRTYKVNHAMQQEMEIRSVNQFQDGMCLPFSLAREEQLQPFSWIPSDHSQHRMLSKDLSLLPQRVIGESEGFAGTSLGSYSGFFGSSGKVDITKIGEEHDFVNEFSTTGSLSLQLSEQHNQQVQEHHSYPSYDFGLLCDQMFPSTELINVEENTSEYDIDRRFEVPHSAHDSNHSIWESASGTCPVAAFDEHLYPQDAFHVWRSAPGNPQDILYTESIEPREGGLF